MRRWVAVVPLTALVGLAAVGAIQLARPDKAEFSLSANRAAPETSFAVLNGEQEVQFAPPPDGKTIALNLFASWCGPCRAEHGELMKLSGDYPERVYGLAYKDTPQATREFLTELGDPFRLVGMDVDGQGGLDFGLTGVPETFVIGPDGTIKLHVRGPMNDATRLAVAEALAD